MEAVVVLAIWARDRVPLRSVATTGRRKRALANETVPPLLRVCMPRLEDQGSGTRVQTDPAMWRQALDAYGLRLETSEVGDFRMSSAAARKTCRAQRSFLTLALSMARG